MGHPCIARPEASLCNGPVDGDVREGSERMVEELEADPAFSRTASVLVVQGDDVVLDLHRRGPRALDTFSVTKTVVSLLLGMAVHDGLVDLDDEVVRHLPTLSARQLEGQTLRHLA